MSVVFFLLFIAAVVGIFRPYINGIKRSHFAIAAVVSFFCVGIFAPKDDDGSKEAKAGPVQASLAGANASAPGSSKELEAEPASSWEYSDSKDEMRGTTTRFASVESENAVNLEFPYGEVHGHLWVRKRAEDGLNVAFEVDKGQVLCHSFSDDYVSIKFDNGPIQKFRCTGSSDGSSETAFLEDEQRALSALKRAKKTTIEAEFFQQGRQQFVFDTEGLKWE